MENLLSILTWKLGMTQVKYNGVVTPVTLLQIKPHEVLQLKTKKTDKYNAICFSAGDAVKESKLNKPQLKVIQSKSMTPRETIFEVRLPDNLNDFELESNHVDFSFLNNIIGSFVDAKGISLGKGFSGVMKRWNFQGHRASHGASLAHRVPGSTGQNQDPGKVIKGKKMPGRYGSEGITVQNLKVALYDEKLGILGVIGAVPGHKNSTVLLKNAVKKGVSSYVTLVDGLKLKIKE